MGWRVVVVEAQGTGIKPRGVATWGRGHSSPGSGIRWAGALSSGLTGHSPRLGRAIHE